MATLCLGEALVDLVCETPVSGIADAPAFVPHFGGATANVAVAAARRGAKVDLAGGAGDDAWGRWLRSRLEDAGVGLDWFRLVPGQQTPIAFVTVDEDAQPSFLIQGEGIGTAIEAVGPRLLEAVEQADALFFGSNTLVGEAERELTVSARDQALALNIPVIFDPNLRLHRWPTPGAGVAEARACVKESFLVKCNREEARLLTGESDPAAAAAGLLAGGAQHVVITLGADGAILRGGGLKLDVPGVPVTPVDTTGAGDLLIGALIAALDSTRFYPASLAAALPAAVEAAARSTEHWGARG
ncbi:carbohydrate kinase family protein [Paraconexibacter sp.]|uniref:carbohydrate kinase family protein n=1 Tax=Paraconexibacter sp. TaxID=2949640 RepID=UPI003565F32D